MAQKLDGGDYRGVSLWYEAVHGSKGPEVAEFWLEADEVPTALRDGLVCQVGEHWAKVDRPLPTWLDQVTVALLGEVQRDELRRKREECIRRQEEAAAERRRQEEEERQRATAEQHARLRAVREAEEQRQHEQLQGRAEEIRRLCTQQQITTLVHFTPVCNLRSILQSGLRSQQALAAMQCQHAPHYNDLHRLDGCPNAVCLSISFPNYKMLYSISGGDRTGWAIVLLDAALLWELDCAFCQENAASRDVTFIPLGMRKQPAALARLFGDYPTMPRQQLGIPACFPTHPQAEVLVFDPIPVAYLQAVHFGTQLAVPDWLARGRANFQQQFVCSDQYFRPRQDWQQWQ